MLEDDGPSPKAYTPTGAGDGEHRHTLPYFIYPVGVFFGGTRTVNDNLSIFVG